MRFPLSHLAVTAGVLATAGALSSQDIPADLPVSSLLNNAQSHLANGETSEALLYYDAAIARDPSNYLTLFKRATTYLSLGRANQATEDFNKVLALKPDFEGAHLQLAKIKSKIADWEGARAQFVAANKDDESPELVELTEAESAAAAAHEAAKLEKWEDCVSNAGTALYVAPRSLSLRELRSKCRLERGEMEEAMGDLQHVLHIRPGDTKPHLVVSATTFYGLADLDAGLAQIRKCLHSDPDSKVCKKLHKQEKAVQKAFTRATGQLNKGQTTTAGRTLVGTAEEPGLVPMVQEHISELREDGSIPTQAKPILYNILIDMTCQAYLEVCTRANNSAISQKTVTNFHNHKSNHKSRDQYCEEALELDADSFWGLLHKAKKLLKQEEYEASIQTLEKARELHPGKADKLNPIMNKAQVALKRSKTKDYYKVLGVASDADERQIKSAYRKASKAHHPDKAHKYGITKEEAEKKMASINEAYEVLSDPELRARFDRGDDPNSQETGGNPFQGSPFGNGHPFMFQQGGGGGGSSQFKFHFGGGGNPFGF